MRSLALETYPSVNSLAEATVIAIAARKTSQSIELVPNEFDSLPVEDLKLKQLGFKAKFGEVKLLTWRNYLIAVVGIGDTELTPERYRQLGGYLASAIGSNESLALGFEIDSVENQLAIVEGCALAGVGGFSMKSSPEPETFSKLFLPTSFKLSEIDIANLGIMVQAVSSARQLVNMPSNLLYPESFANKVKELVDAKDVEVDIWDFRKLNRERCEGILAVGAGSFREPRLVKISYKPSTQHHHLALVGKGITFDTGGISLKPPASMAGMKYDMAGAATIFAATLAIARLNLPVKVTAWLCIAENMPSGSAAKPNDVVTYRNGKTVEIMNTDAEGRLVLADGLILASEENPDLIVDVATLTGAASVALGKRYGAVMGNGAGTSKVMEAFIQSGESAWLMPMPEELRELLESPIADIANAKLGNTSGGMLLGAHFLAEFVGKQQNGSQIPWAHLDIAGPANNDGSPHGYTPKGATGYSVRTLTQLGRLLAEPSQNEE